jgi:hypothetical protein
MKAITQQFIGTTEEWENENPRLYEAALGFEIREDGRRFLKIGRIDPANPDLALRWNNLPYVDMSYIQGLPEYLAAVVAAYQAGLQQEAQTRTQADAAEALARTQADTRLQQNIDTEAARRTNDDEELRQIIAAEAAARRDADTELRQSVDAEIAARINGDAELEQGIEAETAGRINADGELQTNIGRVEAETDANRFAFQYLLQFIIAKLGPLDVIALATESGDHLVTEPGNRLIK